MNDTPNGVNPSFTQKDILLVLVLYNLKRRQWQVDNKKEHVLKKKKKILRKSEGKKFRYHEYCIYAQIYSFQIIWGFEFLDMFSAYNSIKL